MGWAEKSKGIEWRPCQADREGLGDQGRRWLRVSSAWGSKSGQRLGGKVAWQEDMMEIRWFLAVRIDRFAGRERWFWGGTYWKVRAMEEK